MEDELDDKVIYQTYISHMKLLSRLAWGLPLNVSPLAFTSYIWRLLRAYMLKPEVLIIGSIIFVIVIYLQAVDVWSRNLLGRLQYTINKAGRTKAQKLSFFNTAEVEKSSWEMKMGPVAAYAIQGRRPKMEDRFVINDNINNTGVALFAVFDGHGGEFAANYAKEKLVHNLSKKVVEIKSVISGNPIKEIKEPCAIEEKKEEKPSSPTLLDRRKSFRRTSSTAEECEKTGKPITDTELLNKLDNLVRPISRAVRQSKPIAIKEIPLTTYFNKLGTIDYGKLITDEVLAADQLLVETAKKSMDVAGTTALIALLEGSNLIVANVGDSRGVMCDSRGNAIPLSFDHKPQQMRERRRIKEAGGFVTFNGVWRVAGILATSRSVDSFNTLVHKTIRIFPLHIFSDCNKYNFSFENVT